MTEDSKLGRVDLRDLEEATAEPNAGKIIRAAIARAERLHAAPAPDEFQEWRPYLRPVLIAAGLLVASAIGTASTMPLAPARPANSTPIATIIDWTQSHHLPSNGELLIAFQGYGK
jgi:hypothetical protein